MKKYAIILIVLFFTCLTACEKSLKEDGSKQLTSDVLNDPIGFDYALTSVYSQLRRCYGVSSSTVLTESGIDAFTNSSVTVEPDFYTYNASGMNSQHSYFLEFWKDSYTSIDRANVVIELSTSVKGIDNKILNIKVAEARFLRALFYFNLVRTFGDVPLRLESTKSLITNGTRTPRLDVYNAIITDLNEACQYLPYIQTQYGRATRYSAFHLLAKVYLTRGWITDQPQDFSNAVQCADSVILNKPALSNASLSFKDIWDENSTNLEVASEVLFTVQYVSAEDKQSTNGPEGEIEFDGDFGNQSHIFFLWKYDRYETNVLVRDIYNGRPFGYFRITNKALALFDQVNDSRYQYSFESVYKCNKAGTNKLGNTLAIGDTCIWFPGKELTPAQVAAKKYSIILPSMYTNIIYPSLIKFRDTKRISLSIMVGKRDFFVFRLADTYLTSAEAYYKLNDLTNAAIKLNAVRQRAAYPGKESAMLITSANVSLDFILDERIRELCGEGERWYDLSRTHTLVRRCNEFNTNIQAAGFVKDFHELRPIPQDEINLSFGTSIQNQGY